MWIALLALLYSPGPLLTLFLGLRGVARAARDRRWDSRAWRSLSVVVACLTGRWWIRLLRPIAVDEPKPLVPARSGYTEGQGGVRLEWEQFGSDDAPTILLSHGWALTHDTWYYQKLALAAQFRVIVWNMRGIGKSDAPTDDDYSLAALVEDLARIFDATDAGRHPSGCLLAGHSLGAMLLPLFADAYPQRMTQVRGLALIDGTDLPLLQSMRGRRWLVPGQRCVWEPTARLLARYPIPFQAVARLFWQLGIVHLAAMYTLYVSKTSRGQTSLIASHCATVGMRAAGLGALSCFRFDARASMASVQVPTLLLTGESDANMPPETQWEMASRLRQPEVIILPKCGHVSILECHEEVNAHLLHFANRCFLDTE